MPHTLAAPEMCAKSKGQRRPATKGETLLWYELRALKAEGLKFRRQSPRYIGDFVCFNPKIVLEVDGDLHETDAGNRHDANRDACLTESGFLALRCDATDAIERAWHVAQHVKEKAGARPRLPHPARHASHPPRQGEGK